ncbi:oxygenase MpaB family protein [Streptomyces sp. NPDC048629]|uniref:oxygenase MpaB family protein n=1 Tax=Streptomyces sp. NPDC048629 TaxID=3154824 RepID=UPI0034356745
MHATVADAITTYRGVALRDFVAETHAALSLALYHLSAVPGIATTLQSTGRLSAAPELRVHEVSRLLLTILDHGFDDLRSRSALRAMNRVHRNFTIPNDEFLYALSTFVIVPTRFIATAGPRPLTTTEREGTSRFYSELGRLMGVKHIPGSYTEFEEYFDAYERRHARGSVHGRELSDALSAFHRDTELGDITNMASPAVRAAIADPPASSPEQPPAFGGCPFAHPPTSLPETA